MRSLPLVPNSTKSAASVFELPLLPSPSQDPWVVRHGGEFLAVRSDGRRLYVHRAPRIEQLFRASARCVWSPPTGKPYSGHLWAPELHRMDGRWLIYHAADDGRNRQHRIWVLGGCGDDPAGDYRVLGLLETGGWSIDATLLRDDEGTAYAVWSGWSAHRPGAQNLYIAPLHDAVTLAGPRTLLSRPTRNWERHGSPVCEGPAILRRDGVTCIVYSASASWTTRSCLGMLVNRDGNYLRAASWTKVGPVFDSTASVWGVGHCSFLQNSPDGLDMIFYHAKTARRRGWRDRNIRAQSFTWGKDGLPRFGEPLPLQ